MKQIEITPDWILEKLPHTHHVDSDGMVSVYTDCATNAHWIEKALDTLIIPYETYDYLNDHNDFVFAFDFRIEDIKTECPSLFKRMRAFDKRNNYYKNLIKYKKHEKYT
jgi:hypothetical protein